MKNCETNPDSFALSPEEMFALNQQIKAAFQANLDGRMPWIDITFRFRALSREVRLECATGHASGGPIVINHFD